VSGDELPLLPGMDLFLGVARLKQLAEGRYDLVVVDAGQHESLLRGMAVPDSFRWALRLLLGLDRGPGRSPASVSRAALPTTLIPFEWAGQVQTARVTFEALRDQLLDVAATRLRFVLRPDRSGLDEALVAIPALQIFGLAVESLVVGPLLPDDGPVGLLREQRDVVETAGQIWATRPLLRLPAGPTPGSPLALATIGSLVYGDQDPLQIGAIVRPIRFTNDPEPTVAIDVPGLRREDLGLTLSGDELIVRAGPYRRHILLPEGLSGASGIRAARQGDTLTVRQRSPSSS
jgi:arsenite-transporting ATPase